MIMENPPKPYILVTGCSGLIGTRISKRLNEEFTIIGLDVAPPEQDLPGMRWIECDLTDDTSVAEAMEHARQASAGQLASVIHLAAYYDFSGEPSPLYRTLTVEGTERILQQLHRFTVEQFVFSSTLLVMQSTESGEPLTAAAPTEAEWDYPKSKLATEKIIAEHHGDIPAVILRIAGVYDEDCHSLPLSQQIHRIYQKQLESFVFPGDKQHGQAYVHLDDLVECFLQTVRHRQQLQGYEVFLIGEDDVMSYEELQEQLGELLHGREWPTIRIPKPVAKAGAWVKDKLASNEQDAPFIKPWMIDLADQNYPVSIQRARERLGWAPQQTLRKTLPEMIGRFYHDTVRWYQVNNLPIPASVATD